MLLATAIVLLIVKYAIIIGGCCWLYERYLKHA